MFTGIIEEVGQIKSIQKRSRAYHLFLKASKIIEDTKIGDSISVNGVCLTVIAKEKNILGFEVIPQTYYLTNLNLLKVNQKVNLERSLKIGDRLSGHFLTGHIDGVGLIRKRIYQRQSLCFEIAFPKELARYIVNKGCIGVDGVSLTVAEVKGRFFKVYIISQTLKNTIFSFRNPSDKVNLECDLLAKYIVNYLKLKSL